MLKLIFLAMRPIQFCATRFGLSCGGYLQFLRILLPNEFHSKNSLRLNVWHKILQNLPRLDNFKIIILAIQKAVKCSTV